MYHSLPSYVREAYCSESKQLGRCGRLYHLTGTHSFALVFRSGKKALFFFFFFVRQLQCFAGVSLHVAIRRPSPLAFGRRWMARPSLILCHSPRLSLGFCAHNLFFFFFFFYGLPMGSGKASHPSPRLPSIIWVNTICWLKSIVCFCFSWKGDLMCAFCPLLNIFYLYNAYKTLIKVQ